MLVLSENDIDAAVERISVGLRKYQWLQHRVHRCDVRTDAEFQRRYFGFYRVRRGSDWRAAYFALMEETKVGGADFAEVLGALRLATGRLEASFASKLVATLAPEMPVIDRFVLENLGLRLPYPSQRNREEKIVSLYAEVRRRYQKILRSVEGQLICTKVDARYPSNGISDLKKVDLVLWQHRPHDGDST